MRRLSIALITYNEYENLSRLLPVLKSFADEICIVDMFSTDGTFELAKTYTNKAIQQEWLGYADQKNKALSLCTGKWILSLDADEVPNELLIETIKGIVAANTPIAYKINRKTFFLGQLLQYCWQPDWPLRLFPNGTAKWNDQPVHETLQTSIPTKQLKSGFITHYSYKNIQDHFQKSIKYAQLVSSQYALNGKKGSILHIAIAPIFAFLRAYVFKLGFLDGIPGFIACLSGSYYSGMKYIFLWEKRKQKK